MSFPSDSDPILLPKTLSFTGYLPNVSGGVKTDENRQSEIPENSWNGFCFTIGFRADQRSVMAFSTKNEEGFS